MKKGIIVGVIIGILLSGVVVYATGGKLTADSVSYNKTTVKASLDNLFSDVENGKAKIAEAITNKGVETSSTASYDKIVSNINSISTGNPYLRYDEETKYIQVLDEDGKWIDFTKCEQIPFPGADILYNSGTEFITWNTGAILVGGWTQSNRTTKYSDKIALNTNLTSQTATTSGIYGQYTFTGKLKYLHIMNESGDIATIDCDGVEGTYYIVITEDAWYNDWFLCVSTQPKAYVNAQSGATYYIVGKSVADLADNDTLYITQIWVDNNEEV